MDQYLLLVYAGLTGSVTMITCTVLALTRLMFEYKGKTADFQQFPAGVFECLYLWSGRLSFCALCFTDAIDVATREQLLHNICLLLSSRTREIVKAALGFIKVILFIMDPKTLASHATVMVGTDIIDIESMIKKRLCPHLTLIFTLVFRWKALGASKTM